MKSTGYNQNRRSRCVLPTEMTPNHCVSAWSPVVSRHDCSHFPFWTAFSLASCRRASFCLQRATPWKITEGIRFLPSFPLPPTSDLASLTACHFGFIRTLLIGLFLSAAQVAGAVNTTMLKSNSVLYHLHECLHWESRWLKHTDGPQLP